MRISKTGAAVDIGIDRARDSLEFAARGINDSGVEVVLRWRGAGFGYGTASVFPDRTQRETVDHRVTLDLVQDGRVVAESLKPGYRLKTGRVPRVRTHVLGQQRIYRFFPQAMDLRDVADQIVFFGSFAFRKLALMRRNRLRSDYDPAKFAHIRLGEYYAATGRNYVAPRKQDDPFKEWRERTERRRQEERARLSARLSRPRRAITISEDDE